MNRTGHLTFDLSLDNVEDDRTVPKTVYQDLLPNIHSLALESEPSVRSLYNHTPNVLLYLAPQLQYMTIANVNLIDLFAIEGIFPLLPGNTKVSLTWDHMRKLGERNHSVLDKVAELVVDITERDTVTVDSLVLLHEWASSNIHKRTLHVYVDHWTIAMQTVFMSACAVIQPLSDGLERFHLNVRQIEQEVFESTDPAYVVWSRFVSTNTYGYVHLSVPGAATRFTFQWLGHMLQIFIKSSHVTPSLYLDCEEEGDWYIMKQWIDRLVLNSVERTRDAYMSAIGTTAFPTKFPDYDELGHVYELELLISCPQTEMGQITYTPLRATDLQTQANYQDPTKVAFTIQLQTAMFKKNDILLEFEEKMKPQYNVCHAKTLQDVDAFVVYGDPSSESFHETQQRGPVHRHSA